MIIQRDEMLDNKVQSPEQASPRDAKSKDARKILTTSMLAKMMLG
jgi:hypothetical protein